MQFGVSEQRHEEKPVLSASDERESDLILYVAEIDSVVGADNFYATFQKKKTRI